MTRQEIALTLAAIASEGPSGGPPSSASSSRKLAAILLEQERRLRVLEPCEKSPHPYGAHDWHAHIPPMACRLCGVTR